MKKTLFLAMVACAALSADPIVVPKHEHKINLGLLHLGYEHIKPDAIYAGLDAKMSSLWLSLDDNNYKALHFLNGEFRLGYNFVTTPIDTVTPYVGTGHTHYGVKREVGNIRDWTYGAMGVRYVHDFGSIFSMGFHLKAAMSVIEKIYKEDDNLHLKLVSYQDARFFPEFGLSFVWHFGDTRAWELNLEPYYAQVPNQSIQHIVGSKLLLGCRY